MTLIDVFITDILLLILQTYYFSSLIVMKLSPSNVHFTASKQHLRAGVVYGIWVPGEGTTEVYNKADVLTKAGTEKFTDIF